MKIILSAVLAYFIILGSANAQMYQYPSGRFDGQDLYTYVGTSDLQLKVDWTPVEDATQYQVELYSVDRNVYVARANTPTVGLNIRPPHQGLFIVRVRAIREPISGPVVNSNWVTSDDPEVGLVNGKQKGWWVYSFLAPPGQIQ